MNGAILLERSVALAHTVSGQLNDGGLSALYWQLLPQRNSERIIDVNIWRSELECSKHQQLVRIESESEK
eukprot:SAG31_NODE_1272_length_9064_cov_5.201004_3_plen_70_part_00